MNYNSKKSKNKDKLKLKKQTGCLNITTYYEKKIQYLADVFNISKSEILEIAIFRLYEKDLKNKENIK